LLCVPCACEAQRFCTLLGIQSYDRAKYGHHDIVDKRYGIVLLEILPLRDDTVLGLDEVAPLVSVAIVLDTFIGLTHVSQLFPRLITPCKQFPVA
jgi:hypothetical protein